MKILSRFDVPTLEAGTIPPSRPQIDRPVTASSAIAPSDSASQMAVRPTSAVSFGGSAVKHVVTARCNAGVTSNSFIASAVDPSGSVLMPPPSHFNAHAQQPPTSSQSRHPPAFDTNAWQQPSASHVPGGLALITTTDSSAQRVQGSCNATGPYSHDTSLASGARSLLLEKASPPAIDTYTPRPSTAPVTTEHLNQLLPPRRELSFLTRKAVQTVENVADTGSEHDHAVGENSTGLTNRATTVVTQPTAATTTSKKKRGTAKSTTKAPAARKPRISTTKPKKKANAEPVTEIPVPRIEELLKEASVTQKNTTNIDTQTLLTRAETRRNDASVSNATEAFQQGHDVGPASASMSAVQVSDSQEQLAIRAQNCPPCAPADQLISISTPGAPIAMPLQIRHQSPQRQQDTFDNNIHAYTQAANNNTTSHPTTSFRAPNSALSLLLHDPNFAQPQEKLSAWSALPANVQEQALNTYFCQQLQSPEFTKLCKTIEQNWRKQHFPPYTG